MSEYEKLEWLHSQLSELIDGVEVDLEMMQWFVEDLREPYLKEIEEARQWNLILNQYIFTIIVLINITIYVIE